jgi:arylsulfatase A-like enzyme
VILALWACAPDAPPLPDPTPAPELLPRFDGPVPQNLLMISVDTMRRDRMGRYSSSESLTPFLDELAAEGFAVDDAMACSNWTVASTACVESGAGLLDRAPDRGMIPIVTDRVLAPIPGPEEMLPRWLYDQGGYSSLLVTTNGYFSASYGNAQGYRDIVYDGPSKAAGAWEIAKDHLLPERGGTPLPSPWFLHLHLFEPHRPYTPPDQYLGALEGLPDVPFDLSTDDGQKAAVAAIASGSVSDEVAAVIEQSLAIRYDGEIRFLDDQLRDIWAELDQLGFLDDTLVVFWTDHGEELWDHDVTEHGKLLHAPENAAILWFWARDIVPGAWGGPVSMTDVAPTVLALLGLDIPDTVTGIPLGLAPADRVRYALSDAYLGPVAAVRQDRWKMQFRWGGQRLMVFDAVADPLETTNVYDPADPRTLSLWSLLKPQIEAAEPYVDQDPRGWDLVWPADLP